MASVLGSSERGPAQTLGSRDSITPSPSEPSRTLSPVRRATRLWLPLEEVLGESRFLWPDANLSTSGGRVWASGAQKLWDREEVWSTSRDEARDRGKRSSKQLDVTRGVLETYTRSRWGILPRRVLGLGATLARTPGSCPGRPSHGSHGGQRTSYVDAHLRSLPFHQSQIVRKALNAAFSA